MYFLLEIHGYISIWSNFRLLLLVYDIMDLSIYK